MNQELPRLRLIDDRGEAVCCPVSQRPSNARGCQQIRMALNKSRLGEQFRGRRKIELGQLVGNVGGTHTVATSKLGQPSQVSRHKRAGGLNRIRLLAPVLLALVAN